MAGATEANPSLGPLLPAYDPSGHQTNVALEVVNVTTDTSVTPNVTYGQLAVNASVTPAANQSGAATASVATVKGAPAGVTTQTTVGTQRAQYAAAANTNVELLQNGSTIYIPKNTAGYAVGYVKVATAANSAAVSAEWIEF